MAGDDEVTSTSSSPTSWRDVYALVQDSEKRLTAVMADGFNRQAIVSSDHEVRIRVLEGSDQRNMQSDATTKATIGRAQQVIVAFVLVANFTVAALAFLVGHS